MMAVSGIGPNDCIVTDNTITSARNIIEGHPLNPINFFDLCNFIEMVILHERIIMTIPSLIKSSLKIFVDKKIVTSTLLGDATSDEQSEKEILTNIHEKCVRAFTKGAVFGRGIMDVDGPEKSYDRAVRRINVASVFLTYELGEIKVAQNALKDFLELYNVYKIFTDYADSVFDAARYFHIDAYVGSSEMAYPFQNMIKSVPMMLYGKLKELHKDKVDKFLISCGYKTYDIPPFALIVLDRCKSRDDIVPEILNARDEFSDFRETCTNYSKKLKEAVRSGHFNDITDLNNEIDKAFALLTKKAKSTSNDSRLVYRVWDVVKAVSPTGIIVNLIDNLKKYDIDRETLRSVNGLQNVWSKLQKGSPYEKILRSELFQNEFKDATFVSFKNHMEYIRKNLTVPIGRLPEK